MKKFIAVLCMLLMLFSVISVSAAEEYQLLVDGGFEENDDIAWTKYVVSFVDFSEEAQEGSYSLSVSDRSHHTDIVRQYITEKLAYYGKGEYQMDAYVRLGEDAEKNVKVQVVVGAYTADEKKWATSDFVEINTDEWTHITAKVNITWNGELEQAEFYFITDESEAEEFQNILIDSCSLKALSYTGEVFKTPEPTPTPTKAPVTTKAPESSVTQTAGATADTQSTSAADGVAGGEEDTGTSRQSLVIGGMFIAIGVILAVGGVALFLSWRRGKKNEELK